MKLSDLHNATCLRNDRHLLLSHLSFAEGGHGVHIQLGSKYIDKTLVEAALPGLVAALKAKIAEVDAQLAALGVEVDS